MAIITGGNQSGSSSYEVLNSARFDDITPDYLHRTPSSAGTRTKYTISVWLKRSNVGEEAYVIAADNPDNNTEDALRFAPSGTDQLQYMFGGSSAGSLITNAVFRDIFAWYHVVVAVDTTQSTASDRVKIYVNGSQVTSFATETYPAQNYTGDMTDAGLHRIAMDTTNTSHGFDGYMSEFVLIDGQQLTPSSFGETDTNSGIWKPKQISGLTFGTTGFYLEFQTASALGDDTSGNNNDWTSVNLATTNQAADAPSNNWCTGNPLYVPTSGSNGVPSEWEDGATVATNRNTSLNWGGEATFRMQSGKWYWEVKVGANMANGASFGIFTDGAHLYNGSPGGEAWYLNTGNKQIDQSNSSYGASYTDDDILSFSYDADNGILVAYKNGVSQGNLFTAGSGKIYVPAFTIANGSLQQDFFNFGNSAATIASGNSDGNGYGNFEYAVPSGFYALNTKNLAEFG